MSIISNLKARARQLKAEVFALYFAAQHPQTPWYAKFLIVAIVAYALSPIDLIPDFIPVLGYLDDLLIVPLGLLLVIRLLPPEVLAESRDALDPVGRQLRATRDRARLHAGQDELFTDQRDAR